MKPSLAAVLAVATVPFAALHAATAQTSSASALTLMPVPAHLTTGAGAFSWTPSVTIGVTHFRNQRLDDAIQRSLLRLERATGVPRQRTVTTTAASSLVIDVDGPGDAIQSIDEDESYTLSVSASGIKLHAATVVGAMRGLTTLEQLVQASGNGFILPAVDIQDTPRFRWRGLMIDTGRHFEPVEVIKRNLDAMAAVKLNVFHWHLSEDQGFRIESKIYPKLTGMGSDGLFYTQEQAKEIVAYAAERGIRVIPEFDMPGHTKAWLVGYPELSSDPGPYSIRREFGVDDDAMDPTKESTYKFIDAFLGEMATIFPDPYLHLGGDETPGTQWKKNAHVTAYMKAHNFKNTEELQTYFSQRVLELAKKHGKHLVGWDEILTPNLPTDAIIQSWRGVKSLSVAATRGYQGILSAPYYLDGMKSAEDNYLADPIPADTTLTPAQQKFVLGGEVCMWGEQLNELSIDSRIWPRAAAVAERFWSSADQRNVDDMYRRLSVESLRIEADAHTTHLTHEGAALRELAGTEDIDALRTFSSILQPVSFGERYHFQHTSQITSLDLLVDAVRPDPPSRHNSILLVADLLKSPKGNSAARAQLTRTFQSWIDAAPIVSAQMDQSPLLAQARPRLTAFASLGHIGLDALTYLNGKKAPAGWKQKALADLEAARKPEMMLRFTVIDALHNLVDAVQ
ncbi:MAG: beta-N-acetylhexosaminidase [Edaphobacter sp.]|uniref:beta-N-acetylhexosaminidase n=1 Tax=Edaphobacter sp. TaxID=1934404 RepID=UPI002392C618|nr:beta-N-acetylhexosaminidase [Edaphobacter sp.]MDE1178498.1 beta-N-acetylhexosaminidase [Edaphobacter sp.]